MSVNDVVEVGNEKSRSSGGAGEQTVTGDYKSRRRGKVD